MRPLLVAPEPPRESAVRFVCGAPQPLCGDHLPAGVTCTQGPGWCQPGYYCGYRLDRGAGRPAGDQRCRPLDNCGRAGKQLKMAAQGHLSLAAGDCLHQLTVKQSCQPSSRGSCAARVIDSKWRVPAAATLGLLDDAAAAVA